MKLKTKLKCILLIDDDEHDNFYHERIIDKAGISEKVFSFESGLEALEYLNCLDRNLCPIPDLIFLDFNMPGMDGWGFLEAYNALTTIAHDEITLVMLTTSENPYDKKKVKVIPNVSGYENKPLTKEMLEKIALDWKIKKGMN